MLRTFLLLFLFSQISGYAYPISSANTPLVVYQQGSLNENDSIRAFYTTNNSNPALGEHIQITLTITAPSPLALEQVPAFPDDGIVFEVIETGEPLETTDTEFWQYSRTDEIIIWQIGEHTTPEQIIAFDGQQNLPIQSVTLVVISQLPTDSEISLRPDFAQRDLPYTPLWVIVTVILMISAFISGLIWWTLKRINQQKSFAHSDMGQDTIQQLLDVGHTTTESSLALALIANILRRYLQEKCQINASEMTTDELNNSIQSQDLIPDEQRRQVIRVLEQADLVKFAQFNIDDRAIANVIAYSVRWVETVEQHFKQTTNSQQESLT